MRILLATAATLLALAACMSAPADIAPADANASVAPMASDLRLVALKGSMLEVRSASGEKYVSRDYKPGEFYVVRVGAGYTVSAGDGTAFEWRRGDQSLGLLQAEGGPVVSQAVDLAAQRQAIAVAPQPPTPAPPPAAAPNSQAFARSVDLGAGISMLIGQGGNLGLSVGEDGVFLIDDQYATNATANLAKIEEVAKGKPKYLINTHWHGDHAGGNEVFAKAGATVFASENVRKRLTGEVPSTSRTGQVTPASPKAAWPLVTFTQGIDFHLNGQTIRAINAPGPTHTDGDVLIYFVEADILHMGDTYMKDRYPFVDTGSGGRQQGFIDTLAKALTIGGPNTKIIPGHGELATKADLQAALDMHKGARAAVDALVKQGKTLAETVAAKPLAQWNARFGGAGSFITDDAYVTVIYNELKS